MKYITVDELKIITRATEAIKLGVFAEVKEEMELQIGDSLNEIVVDGIRTLKYSNVLLIGVSRVED